MSLDSIATSVFQGFLNFFTNLLYIFLTPVVNIIWNFFPKIGDFFNIVHQGFSLVTKYVLYILDASLIYKPVIILCIGTIIYKITYSQIIAITKIIVKWWHYLAP